ncbi:transcriptional regulator, partial [Listeria monocytogenes]|nr:transcriptional regulator [Listeria monocytogenes]
IEKFTYTVSSRQLKMSLVLNLGLFLKFANKMDLAIEFIEMGIDLAKQNEDLVIEYLAYYRKAEYLLYKGYYEEANKIYNKSVEFYKFIENEIMLNDITKDWLNYRMKLELD